MRKTLGFMPILAASLGMALAASPSAPLLASQVAAPSRSSSRKKDRRTRMIAGGFKAIRSRGAPGKRKSKSNRNIISKRVRRKHRRSA